MTQVPLFVALFLLGVLVTFAGRLGRWPALAVTLAFPVGTACVTIGALLLLGVGLPFTPATIATSIALLTTLAALGAFRTGALRPALKWGLSSAIPFAALASALCYRNLSNMTTDSHRIVMLGVVLGQEGALRPDTLARFSDFGAFQIVAQSLHILTLQDYLYALPAVTNTSFIFLFASAVHAAFSALGIPAKSISANAFVGLVTLACFTIFQFQYHIPYIHTNASAALYLFGFVALFWLAEITKYSQALGVAFLCLFAFSMQRVEAPALSLLVLVFTLLISDLPRRAVLPYFAAFSLGLSAWYVLLALHVSASSAFLTPTRCLMVVAAILGFFGFWVALGSDGLARFRHWLPPAAVLLCVLLLIIAVAVKPEHMQQSAEAWAKNLFELPQWGYAWYILLGTLLLCWVLQPPPFASVFTLGTAAHALVILLLAFGRVPYRHSVHDSANRMTLHFLPLLVFYLALKIGLALFHMREESALAGESREEPEAMSA